MEICKLTPSYTFHSCFRRKDCGVVSEHGTDFFFPGLHFPAAIPSKPAPGASERDYGPWPGFPGRVHPEKGRATHVPGLFGCLWVAGHGLAASGTGNLHHGIFAGSAGIRRIQGAEAGYPCVKHIHAAGIIGIKLRNAGGDGLAL